MKSQKNNLDVGKVIEEFRTEEEKSVNRKATFKIDAPFEKALDIIIKAKPESKKTKAK